jgi:uncharacterized protein YjaZ
MREMKRKDQLKVNGVWDRAQKAEEQVTALTAEVERLKVENAELRIKVEEYRLYLSPEEKGGGGK